jgi:plasmid replication initiation protein
MSDFNAMNKVVQDNALVHSFGNLDKITIKLFEICVSAINPLKPPVDHTVYLNKRDLFFMFQNTENINYTRFGFYLKRLQKQVVQVNQPNGKVLQLVPVPTIEYGTSYDDQQVRVVFNSEIMPFLIDLRKNFTQYPIYDLYGIKNKYSLILFQYAYAHYSRLKPFTEDFCHFTVSVEELRQITGTTNILGLWANFELRVLKDSIDEINHSWASIKVFYEKVKTGRKITHVKFTVVPTEYPYHAEKIDELHRSFTKK